MDFPCSVYTGKPLFPSSPSPPHHYPYPEKTGELLFRNAWVTNRSLSSQTVPLTVKAGRTRWKVENEIINVLKNQRYHLQHNFGHGKQHFVTVLCSLSPLAFLIHTAQHLTNEAYRVGRRTGGQTYNWTDKLQSNWLFTPCIIGVQWYWI